MSIVQQPEDARSWDEKAAALGEYVTIVWGILSGWMMHLAGPALFVTFAAITAQTAPGTGWDKFLFVTVQVSLDVAGTGLVILGDQQDSPKLKHFGWFLVSLTITTVVIVTGSAIIAPNKQLTASIAPALTVITQVLTMVRAVVSVLYIVIMHSEHENKKKLRKALAAAPQVQIQQQPHQPQQQIQEAQAPATNTIERDRAYAQLDMVEDRMYKMLTPQILAELMPYQHNLNALVDQLHQRFPGYTQYLTRERVENVMHLVRLDQQLSQPEQATPQPEETEPEETEPNTGDLENDVQAPIAQPVAQVTRRQTAQPAARKKREVTGVQSKPRAVFTQEIAQELENLLNDHPEYSQNQLAKHFNVSPNTIKRWTERLEVNA